MLGTGSLENHPSMSDSSDRWLVPFYFGNIVVTYLGIVSSFTNLNKTFILSCKFCRLLYALIKLDKGFDVR